MMNAEYYLDKVIELHRDRYADNDSELIPMVFFVKDGLPMGFAQLISTDGSDWREALPSLKELPIFEEADGYIISSEAWLAHYPVDSDLEKITMPSKREDKIEVIINVIFMKDGEKAMKNLKIIRGETGKVIKLESLETFSDQFESRFDLYAKEKVLH